MSFVGFGEVIKEGEVVILYLGYNKIISVLVKEGGEVLQTCYGGIKMSDILGSRYGSKIRVANKENYVYALRPTPELWTKVLPHRTQILYSTDASLVIMGLEIRPNSVVIESGTGSGSLTHALGRLLGSNGRLYSYDFHEKRAEIARQELELHGLSERVKVGHRDVCSQGFGLDSEVDAVFLDLPHPWEALQAAKKALKPMGRICTFSPCLEQVHKSAEGMKALGFKDIRTLEVLLREFHIKRITQRVYHHICDSEEEPPQKKTKKSIDTKFVSATPPTTMPGHTGYLTFATLSPPVVTTS